MYDSAHDQLTELSPPKTREQERGLLSRAQGGDTRARDELVLRNMRFVFKMAKRVARTHRIKRGDQRVEFNDLVQEGTVALIRAANQFDLGHQDQVRFITYAARAIINEMNRRANRAFDLVKTKQHVQRVQLHDSISYSDPRREAAMDLHRALKKLRPQTRDVLTRHYFNDEEYKDIALSYGVCPQRIHQIARDGVVELRGYLGG